MVGTYPHASCRLTPADHAHLGRLRDQCRGLIDRAHASIHRSAALLRQLPWRPRVPDWPVRRPAAGDADVAELWASASASSRAAQAVVERAAREVALAARDSERARQLRLESSVLRRVYAAVGHRPPPAPAAAAGGGVRMPGERPGGSARPPAAPGPGPSGG